MFDYEYLRPNVLPEWQNQLKQSLYILLRRVARRVARHVQVNRDKLSHSTNHYGKTIMVNAHLSSTSTASTRRGTTQSDQSHDKYFFRLNVHRTEKSNGDKRVLDSSSSRITENRLRPKEQNVNGKLNETSVVGCGDQYPHQTLALLPLAGCSLAELERETIQQTLAQNEGNRKRSAESLGISVRTLQRKLKEWNGEADRS